MAQKKNSSRDLKKKPQRIGQGSFPPVGLTLH